MADSDNSTTLPCVITRSDGKAGSVDDAGDVNGDVRGDVPAALLGCWRQANGRVHDIGSLIDSFERRSLGTGETVPAGMDGRSGRNDADNAGGATRASGNSGGWAGFDNDPGYAELRDAEFVAMTAEESLIDLLPSIEARTLEGAIAKLEIIAGADGLIEEPEAFPMPHLRSVLADLRRLAMAHNG